jgi:hypothetical protein
MTTTPLALSHSRNDRERQASRRCASSGAGRPAESCQPCAARRFVLMQRLGSPWIRSSSAIAGRIGPAKPVMGAYSWRKDLAALQ